MTIRVYTSRHCEPCQEIHEKIKEGKVEAGEDEIELIDIETDEGFAKFTEEVLNKEDGAVPSAYKEGQRCIVGFTQEGNVIIECPINPPVASEQE